MVHWVGAVIVGLLLGFTPKRVNCIQLVKLFALNLASGGAVLIIALVFGLNLVQVMALSASHITVSALTMIYAIFVGIAIKALFCARKGTSSE